MWSPKVVIIMYYIVAVLFIPIGVAVLVKSLKMVSTERRRYDQVDLCDVGGSTNSNVTKTCTVKLDIDYDLKAPSYMYYGMVNFYQNARQYADSRSDEQLRGNADKDIDTCDPLTVNGTDNSRLVPCGLIAMSRFNDTFELCRDRECKQTVDLKSTGIAWDIDRNKRFLGSNESYSPFQNAIIRSEDFMVWMRIATYRNWHKLYRIIETDLPAGPIYVKVHARFPVESFEGEKFVFIAETTWFGGRNVALGIAYLAVGGVAMLLATVFAVRARINTEIDLPPESTVYFGPTAAEDLSSHGKSSPREGERTLLH